MELSKKHGEQKSFNFFLPIAFILTIIPLIVRLAIVEIDLYTADILGAGMQTDLFSQKKAFCLMIFCIILIGFGIIFFKKIFEKKDKVINYILIGCGVFWFFTLLSAIFSQYKQASFWGMYDRAEGFITLTCYMILLIYSIYTFKSTRDYKFIVIPILILVVINSFLGLFQYIGQDLIKSELGISIVVPSEYQSANTKIDLLYEKGKLYGTLFHYNYVGSFIAIVLPILFCLTIFEKELFKKISLGIGSLLSIWLLFGSTSRAGIIGIFAATLLGIIMFNKLLVEKWKPILISLVCILILAVSANFATKGTIFERLPNLVTDIFSVFKDTSDVDYTQNIPIKDIQHIDKGVSLILPNETLKIVYENGSFVFRNSKDEIVQYNLNKNLYTTDNEAFKNVSFNFGKIDKNSIISDGLLLRISDRPLFMFKLKPDKSIHLINKNTRKDIEIEFPETIGFKGKEKLGSMRGYIWGRSIPMLKENLILGSGPDTFVYRFPQNDLIGKYYAYDDPDTIVDKPHNLYLQVALNEGAIALLGFIAIMIIYIVDSIRLYALKKKYEYSQLLGGATCLGVVGYLFAGIFNDSVVSVAPVFWIVLGVGVALNYMNRKELNKKRNK